MARQHKLSLSDATFDDKLEFHRLLRSDENQFYWHNVFRKIEKDK
jgi:hypothetical protein